MLQESPKAILESTRKAKDKTMIKSEQITDKPSVKSKRKIRPFDIVITSDETKRVIKVSMVREIHESSQSSPNQEDYNDPVPGPSGLHAHENR